MPSHDRTALVVVDVQRDFCPGGALPAKGCEGILPAINRYLAEARKRGVLVYATRDWHPPVTSHFKTHGGEWPPHCVQGTEGAQFHRALALSPDAIVISKGDDPDRPGYSAFDGRSPEGRSFLEELGVHEIGCLYVTGLTTEYCVKQTVLDARRAGLRVRVLTDAIAGIDAHPGDVDRALEAMSKAGAELTSNMASAYS